MADSVKKAPQFYRESVVPFHYVIGCRKIAAVNISIIFLRQPPYEGIFSLKVLKDAAFSTDMLPACHLPSTDTILYRYSGYAT